jgi:putative transposase
LFNRQTKTKEVGELLPQLYLHGLALGDFELALRGLLGDGAPLSPASLLRLKAQWQEEYETWKQRRLDDLEVIYIWADGLYVKAGLEDTKAALLVMIGVLTNGQKVVLALNRGGARLPMDIWGCGQPSVSSILPWRSKDAGITV